MPNAQPQPISDGYVSFVGGCHAAARNPREMAETQLSHLVNATVRGGYLRPRDGFTEVPLNFDTADSRRVFHFGRFQGEGYYSEIGRIIYVVGGRIFSLDPISGEVTGHAAGGSAQPLSAAEEFAFLVERDGYMVIQDGVNRAVILEKFTARRADPGSGEIPTGKVMADGWGRLMVSSPEQDRLYFSDHEIDPESKSWLFTEQSDYYLAARYFQPSKRLGPVMAAEFVPFVDAPEGLGPLLVLGKRASVTYDVSLPRIDGGWVKVNIERLALLNIGTCGHRCVMAVDNDVIFRDQYGRLRTLSQTIREQDQRKNAQRVRRFDREVSPWLKRETAWLRRWADVATFDDRYLFTALPDSTVLANGVRDVWHHGVLAFNLDVLANLRGVEDPTWDGLLTGIRVQAITSGIFDDEPRLFMVSRDSDECRRVYEQREGLKYDVAAGKARSIEWQVGTKWFDFKSPFILKTLDTANLRLGEIAGRLKFEAFVRVTEGEWIPWFTHHAGACSELRMGYGQCECEISEALPQEQDRMILPSLPFQTAFYRIQFMFRITGWCEMREFLVEAVPFLSASTTTDIGCEPAPLKRKDAPCWNDLTYDVISAPEAEL